MEHELSHIGKPRCILLYALAPPGLAAAEANRILNEMVADPALPLVVFHDHFIGRPGGVAIIYAEDAAQRAALANQQHLAGWQVELRPLVFAHSPAAFDEQIAFTLRAYRDTEWDELRREKRPRYGDPGREAETAEEDNQP